MAEKTIKKNIIKISEEISIDAKPDDKSFIDKEITFSNIPSGSYPIGVTLHPKNSQLNYPLPYCTTNGIITTYLYNWNSSSKKMTIRNIGVAWNNYVIEAIFQIP